MTRNHIAYLIGAITLSAAVAAAGFPRPAAAAFATFVALLSCESPRSGLLAQAAVALGLITATGAGDS